MHNDTAKIIITVITIGIAVITVTIALGGWLSMSISDIRSDIRAIRSDMRENRAIAKADSDRNSDQITVRAAE